MGDEELGKLRWRCRRGMKELDVLLGRYIEERFASAEVAEQRTFGELLELQDPVIHAWCFGTLAAPTPELRALIKAITAPTSAAFAATRTSNP